MIVLSNAHHRRWPGAVNEKFGLNEYVYSVEINRRILNLFMAEGKEEIFIIDQSWKTSYNESLREKVRIINSIRPELAIENHLNASKNKNIIGCETLHYTNSIKGQRIAQMIQTQIMAIKEIKPDRGVKERADLIFLRGTLCPAIITEPLFISHDNSVQLLFNEKFLDKVAEAIHTGIKRYLDSER